MRCCTRSAGLPLGRLADRYSRKWIVSGSVLFWSAMTVACGLTKNFTQLLVARMGVGLGEAGLAPPAYSLITDSFKRQHVGYAMSIYKLAVKVGAGLALVIGGVLYDFFASMPVIALPLVGEVKAWQATLISVGAPGLLLSLLLLTIREPSRKGLLADASGAAQDVPFGQVLRYIWERRRLFLSLFFGSSMMAIAQYGAGAWYPEYFHPQSRVLENRSGWLFRHAGARLRQPRCHVRRLARQCAGTARLH